MKGVWGREKKSKKKSKEKHKRKRFGKRPLKSAK
jgi:hypothetical protein